MMHIHLHNLRFHSFHGVYDEEKILGNAYEINLSVGFEASHFPVYHLEQTIDYTLLYEMVKKRMAEPTPLLETIITEITAEIQSKHPVISKICITIKKLYPPVNNFEGAVGVSFEWNK